MHENISAVIPVIRNWGYTKQCIDSIQEKSKLVNEIIVIDNEVYPSTAQTLLELYPNVSVYAPQRNLGVSVSWDTGIKLAKNNIVCVANNDIKVITEGWDEKLLEVWDKLENTAILCPWPCSTEDELLNENNNPLDGLNGSCFFLKKDLIEKTENYKEKGQYIDHQFEKAYWEDCDLLTQVRRAGMNSWVTPKVKTVHYGNKTAGPMLPSHKGLDNPYWANLDRFNKKYNVFIWDCFQVFMSNVLQENTRERLI